MQATHGKRIAVIENEFGEVGIDDALVMESKEEIFEVSGTAQCHRAAIVDSPCRVVSRTAGGLQYAHTQPA